MNIFIKWLITAIAILVAGKAIPGVEITGPWAALWVAVFLGLFNVILRPVLIVLTLPINILTLGLFTFVINALLVLLTSTIIQGFQVEGLLTAVLFSIVLSVVTYFLNEIIKRTKSDRKYSGKREKEIEGKVIEEE
ncbi:MAG: phage holin family protein [Patescibacteria group bacterium]